MSDREAHWRCRSLLNHLDMLLVQPRTERLAKAAAAHNWHHWRIANVTAIGEAGNSDSVQSGCAVRDDGMRFVSKSCQWTTRRKPKSQMLPKAKPLTFLETAAHMAMLCGSL
jgi:hypothetical protein